MTKLVGFVQLVYILWGVVKFKEMSFAKFGFYFLTNFKQSMGNFQFLR